MNPEELRLDLAALGRLSTDLQRLGGDLKRISQLHHVSATPDPSVDMPSLVAARPVGLDTIPELQGTIANRFIEVGYLVDQARTLF